MLLLKAFLIGIIVETSDQLTENISNSSMSIEWTMWNTLSDETTLEPLLIMSSPSPDFDPGFSGPGPLPSPTNRSDLSRSLRQTEPQNLPTADISVFTWDILLTLILPYSIIFVLAVVGNLLVIITLTLNRSMRSVTNIFLLNLAISDLLLGVFCMPFTLVGVLLRRFIFGPFLCHLISYMQTVSVAVSVWTLVAMSIERYYAICQPLRSRERRQTRRHAYRILGLIWTLAIILMLPTAIVSELQMIKQTGNYKCREAWPNFSYKEAFTIFLILILLVIPGLLMILAYTSIAITLQGNLHRNTPTYSQPTGKKRMLATTTPFNEEVSNIAADPKQKTKPKAKRSPFSSTSSTATTLISTRPSTSAISATAMSTTKKPCIFRDFLRLPGGSSLAKSETTTVQFSNHASYNTSVKHQTLRVNSNFGTIQARQRRVVVMLFVVVLEFFVCWLPIFIVDTLALYAPAAVYSSSRNLTTWIGIDMISACHLLCFCSSCTNPLTYSFMNYRFRCHFFALFHCKKGATLGHSTNGTMTMPNAAVFASNATNEQEREREQPPTRT